MKIFLQVVQIHLVFIIHLLAAPQETRIYDEIEGFSLKLILSRLSSNA